MNIRTYLLTLFILSSIQFTLACDCGSGGTFLTVAQETDFVAVVKVRKYLSFKSINNEQIPMSMEVEVIDKIKGEETRKLIVVWGDNGVLCRPYLSKFDTGQYYVIAFFKGLDGSISNTHKNEKPLDYFISICGDYWLNANNATGMATGSVSATLTSISFNDLREQFNETKPKELKPNDYKEIYQLAFDLPKLQQYYHAEKDSTKKQIFILYFGEENHNKLKGVLKFGKQVEILTAEQIKDKKIKNYFILKDWAFEQTFVRMQLSYVGEGITIYYMFKKHNNKWFIENKEILEK